MMRLQKGTEKRATGTVFSAGLNVHIDTGLRCSALQHNIPRSINHLSGLMLGTKCGFQLSIEVAATANMQSYTIPGWKVVRKN